MKYLIKNSSNQNYQNHALYNSLVVEQQPLQKGNINLIWKWFLRVIKKIYKSYTVYNRQALVVHPNQIVNTNLNWTEILRS
jgi:hypothetical protein